MKVEMPATITHRYRCLREIGWGPMGIVYEVLDEYTGAHRAVKLMTLDLHDPRLLVRFFREARLASIVGGEHVVKVIDADVASDLRATAIIAVEMITGRPYVDSPAPGPIVSPAFDAWFRKSCATNPEDGFESAREQNEALAKLMQQGSPRREQLDRSVAPVA